MAATNGTTANGTHNTVALGRYLWERIHQVGVNHVFGVPGDFNLTLLDHIYHVDGLEWVGNTNELNAAYAADGYARTRMGAGCVVTTHGVGELSALNAIAGSMTEQVKVIHVVGQTSLKMQRGNMMIHHSIGFGPDHQIFNKASKDFRVAAAEIQQAQGAAEEIDRVLRECFIKSGPVYFFVPIDLVDVPVPSDALKTPLNLEPEADEKAVDKAANAVLEAIRTSKNPCVFVDCLVHRHNAVEATKALVEKLAIPVYTSNMGKGIIDETHEHYVGLYNGGPSGPGVEDAFDKHDLIVLLGDMPSDTNSGGFTRITPVEKTVFVNSHQVDVKGWKMESRKTPIKAVIKRMRDLAEPDKIPKTTSPKSSLPPRRQEDDHDSKAITQSWVWDRLASWMQPHDVVLGETGTAAFGIPDATFPSNIRWQTQTYYGSIGWATPAALGSDLALADLAARNGVPRGRTLLCTGDGSLMLTVQEIGNMMKLKLSPIIFLINNAGYTIERVIHGAFQSYNDIVPFNYEHMLPFLGNSSPEKTQAQYHKATTKEELEAILSKESVKQPNGVQVVEIVMDMLNVPWRLATQVATRGPQAVQEMREAGFKVREMLKSSEYWK